MGSLIEIRENWGMAKEKLRKKYGILTESDVTWKEGMYEEMLYKLQIILGVSIEDLKLFVLKAIVPEPIVETPLSGVAPEQN